MSGEFPQQSSETMVDDDQTCGDVRICIDGAPDSDSVPRRYEWREGDLLCGLVDYYVFGDIALITHTEVNPALPGKGNGSELARRMLEHVRQEGQRVVPVCGFMAHFMRKNRDYGELATPGARAVFGV